MATCYHNLLYVYSSFMPNICVCKNLIAKLTALSEYLDPSQNFYARHLQCDYYPVQCVVNQVCIVSVFGVSIVNMYAIIQTHK